MKKILFLIGATIILLSSGCGERVEEKRVVSFALRADPGQSKVWYESFDAFMGKNPDIKVKVDFIPQKDYYTKVLTSIAGGASYNIIFIDSPAVPNFVTRGAILDLTPYIEKDQEVSLDNYFSTAVPFLMYEGKVWGLPTDASAVVIYYNKDLFDETKVPYPTSDWDWDEFLSICKKVTRDRDGDGRIDQYGYAGPLWDYNVWIPENAGKWVDKIDGYYRSVFDSPQVKEAIKFIYDLQFKHKVMAPLSDPENKEPYKLFVQKRAAMLQGGHWYVSTFKEEIKDFKWDVVELPHKKQRFGLTNIGLFCITSQTKDPEAAWRLIKYLAGPEGQKIHSLGGRITPVLKSVAQSSYFLFPPPENKQAFLNAFQYPIYPDEWTYKFAGEIRKIVDITESNLELLWVKGITPEEVCDKIKGEVDEILEEAQKTR